MLGTVKGVREADNKARTDPGAKSAAGLALEWPPSPDASFVYNGALRWAENGLTHKQVQQNR